MLGEKNGPPAKDPEAQELLFDTIRRSVNPEHGLRSPLTVQWDFPDADPWYVVVDNGSSRAEQGRAPAPDVTLRSSWRTSSTSRAAGSTRAAPCSPAGCGCGAACARCSPSRACSGASSSADRSIGSGAENGGIEG